MIRFPMMESADDCRHFGTCGGCATRDIPYEEEIAQKEKRLADLLGRSVPVTPSPARSAYRSRMDYVFAWGKMGLRVKGDPRGVLNLQDCRMIPEKAFAAARKAGNLAKEMELLPYSFLSKKGYLRYVTVRVAPGTGQVMLVLLTNGKDPAVTPLLDALESDPEIDSVAWAWTDRRADVSYGDILEVRGRPHLEETLAGVRLRFGPNSFFQANPRVAEALYAAVRDKCTGRATDLFCGVGGIALACAAHCDEVIGVDNNRESIYFADLNRELNGITNARFLVGDARKILTDHRCDTLILDPPRSGLSPKMIRKIVRCAPPAILYVSCNPKILAGELPLFEGYKAVSMEGFDLFPCTPHVETLVDFRRI